MADDKMYLERNKEKEEIRKEVLDEVLEPRDVQRKYSIAVCNRDITLGMNKNLPVSIERGIDNALRNYAHAKGYLPSHRTLKFFEEEGVRKILGRYSQRPVTADVQSICWAHLNNNLTKLEACNLIVRLFPKKASQEIIDFVASHP